MHRVPAQQLPRNIHALAETHQLGELQRIYEQGKSAWLYISLALGCVCLGMGLISIFVFFYAATFSWWPVWEAWLMPVIGVCWLLLGCWLGLTPLFAPRVRVYIYVKGIIYHRRTINVVFWRQVAHFWRAYSVRGEVRLIRYTLECDSGLRIVLNSQLVELELLGQFLDKVVTHRCLPQYIAAYHRGQPLDFALLVVDDEGIRLKQQHRLLVWSELAALELDKKNLTIYRKDMHEAWVTLPFARIPNVSALKRLASYIHQDTIRRQLSEVIAYQQGAMVHFGKLSLSKQGIELHDMQEHVPWSSVASIGVGECEVIIRKQGSDAQWHAIPLWAITDSAALKVLISHIVLRLSSHSLPQSTV